MERVTEGLNHMRPVLLKPEALDGETKERRKFEGKSSIKILDLDLFEQGEETDKGIWYRYIDACNVFYRI